MSAADGSGVLPDLAVSRLYAAVVSDILDDLEHRDHTLDPAIRPLRRGEVIAGFANPFLVTEVDRIPEEPYTGEIAALDDIRPGEVILVAAGGSARAACCEPHPGRQAAPRSGCSERLRHHLATQLE
jgi:regulator of RNase E activity RraA